MTHPRIKRADKRKIFFWLLVSVLVLTVVSAPLDIAALSGHECSCTCGGGFVSRCICGNYCPVCVFIVCAVGLIKTMSLCVALLCVMSAVRAAISRAAAVASDPEAVYSLVSLKVKLSD